MAITEMKSNLKIYKFLNKEDILTKYGTKDRRHGVLDGVMAFEIVLRTSAVV